MSERPKYKEKNCRKYMLAGTSEAGEEIVLAVYDKQVKGTASSYISYTYWPSMQKSKYGDVKSWEPSLKSHLGQKRHAIIITQLWTKEIGKYYTADQSQNEPEGSAGAIPATQAVSQLKGSAKSSPLR